MEERRKGEEGKVRKLVSGVGDRMDELDGMYDDMQDRVFEIDRNRKNNLVFYGVRAASDNGDVEDQAGALFNPKLRFGLRAYSPSPFF